MAAINCDVLSTHLSLYSWLECYTLLEVLLSRWQSWHSWQSWHLTTSGHWGQLNPRLSYCQRPRWRQQEGGFVICDLSEPWILSGGRGNLALTAFLLAPQCTGPCPHTHFYDRSMNFKAAEWRLCLRQYYAIKSNENNLDTLKVKFKAQMVCCINGVLSRKKESRIPFKTFFE